MNDIPSVCVFSDVFNIDHAMICRRGGFIIQRHNEVRDLEAEMLLSISAPTQNHIETLAQSKYIANMKMERSTHTQSE